MTYEEIITSIYCGRYQPYASESIDNKIVKALEKQIPKEPLDFGNEAYLCPYCKRNNFYKGEYLDKQNYCDYCGQAIKWE